jgi:branched-chain amino acid transport system ATP-binding protein
MIVIGRALMASPRMLLLDEPSLGLSPLLVSEIFSIIETINKDSKISILLVEQNARIALNLANYGYVMENGRIVLDDSADRLKKNEDIREFYLGVSVSGERTSYRDIKFYKRRKRWLG